MDTGVEIQRFCITDFPDEYLYLIFGKLDESLARESFGLTCHRFLDIQNSSLKRLDLGALNQSNGSTRTVIIDSSKLDILLQRFRHLDFLSLDGCKYVSDSGLTQFQTCCSKLHSLCLNDVINITDIGLSYVASGCPLLSAISLFRCKITDIGLERLIKSCTRLKEVNLAGCDNITDSGVKSLIQNCHQLRTLNVSYCNQITDIAFRGCSAALEEVLIAGCHEITDNGIRSLIQGCPKLRTLNISMCRKITGVGFRGCSATLACVKADYCVFSSTGIAEILSGGGLEYLSLTSIECTEGNGLAYIGLGRAPNLKFLDFYECGEFVTDDVILSISQGCPLLQEWNLTGCDHISPFGYEPIGLYCQNLERIHLNGCHSFHNQALVALVNGCKRLSVIYIEDGPQEFLLGNLRDDFQIIETKARRIVPSWVFTSEFAYLTSHYE